MIVTQWKHTHVYIYIPMFVDPWLYKLHISYIYIYIHDHIPTYKHLYMHTHTDGSPWLVFACGRLHGAQLWIKATDEELLQAHAAVPPKQDFGILWCVAWCSWALPVRQKPKIIKSYHLKLHDGIFASWTEHGYMYIRSIFTCIATQINLDNFLSLCSFGFW